MNPMLSCPGGRELTHQKRKRFESKISEHRGAVTDLPISDSWRLAVYIWVFSLVKHDNVWHTEHAHLKVPWDFTADFTVFQCFDMGNWELQVSFNISNEDEIIEFYKNSQCLSKRKLSSIKTLVTLSVPVGHWKVSQLDPSPACVMINTG